MNVIKFDIEIKKKDENLYEVGSISSLVEKNFQSEIEYEGNFYEKIKAEWQSIQYENIRSLNSKESLKGYSTVKGATFFLFEKTNNNVRSRTNLSYEVISYGDIPVEILLNLTYKKIKSVISKNLMCEHIGETRIFIYPFNSDVNVNDIHSYQLKVRADLISPFVVEINDIARWLFVFLVGIVSVVIYIKSTDAGVQNVILSVIASVSFYLVLDFILYFLLPFILKRDYRKVKINNLSSVVEAGNEMSVKPKERLTVPEEKLTVPE